MATTKLRRSKRKYAPSNGSPSSGPDQVVDPTDPALLTAEERLAEVAAILAKGVIRMRDQRREGGGPIGGSAPPRVSAVSPPTNQFIAGFSLESAQTGLEVGGDTSPDGKRG